MVLLGLGLLHEHVAQQREHENRPAENGVEASIEDDVEKMSRGIAPILLPMIESLGDLELANE
jgi:hypothetical protein